MNQTSILPFYFLPASSKHRLRYLTCRVWFLTCSSYKYKRPVQTKYGAIDFQSYPSLGLVSIFKSIICCHSLLLDDPVARSSGQPLFQRIIFMWRRFSKHWSGLHKEVSLQVQVDFLLRLTSIIHRWFCKKKTRHGLNECYHLGEAIFRGRFARISRDAFHAGFDVPASASEVCAQSLPRHLFVKRQVLQLIDRPSQMNITHFTRRAYPSCNSAERRMSSTNANSGIGTRTVCEGNDTELFVSCPPQVIVLEYCMKGKDTSISPPFRGSIVMESVTD